MDFITGEKFELFCEEYIGTYDKLNFLPSVRQNKSKHVYLDNFPETYDNPKVIFIHGDLLECFMLYCIDRLQNPFILVAGNSDENITNKYLPLINNPKLIHLFGQNTILVHPKTTNIPIGIANSVWKSGDLAITQKVLDSMQPSDKTLDVFFNFNIQTCPHKRKLCFDIISGKNIPYVPNKDYESYLATLKNYKFCICPEGNGVDCHRIWECLYLKVVPICLDTEFHRKLSKDYPIVLLNSWEDLDVSVLDYSKFTIDMDKLKFSYYTRLVKNEKLYFSQ